MSAADAESLRSFLESADGRALKLTGIVETADSIYLGAVGLDRLKPLFHSIQGFNYSGELCHDAAFRIETVHHPLDGHVAHVAIFRQFHASQYQDHPEDIIMGWFPDEARPEGEGWLKRMADLLGKLLKERTETHGHL